MDTNITTIYGSSRRPAGHENESSSEGSASYNEKISNAASRRLNDDSQGASSVSRPKKSFKSEGDTKKPCSKKANGCFGTLFSNKHNKRWRTFPSDYSDSE